MDPRHSGRAKSGNRLRTQRRTLAAGMRRWRGLGCRNADHALVILRSLRRYRYAEEQLRRHGRIHPVHVDVDRRKWDHVLASAQPEQPEPMVEPGRLGSGAGFAARRYGAHLLSVAMRRPDRSNRHRAGKKRQGQAVCETCGTNKGRLSKEVLRPRAGKLWSLW